MSSAGSLVTGNLTEEELFRARAIGAAVESWYQRNGREFAWRGWTDTYRLVVVEVLLQRTRAEKVAEFAPDFFDHYPDWQALAKADETQLITQLKPIGLQNRRAHALLALARHVVSTGLSGDMPGVGQYVERAIRVMVEGRQAAMVDSNFVRVLHRVFRRSWKVDYRYDPTLQELARSTVEGGKDPRKVNWAVLDLGAMICAPRTPRCTACPIRAQCDFGRAR